MTVRAGVARLQVAGPPGDGPGPEAGVTGVGRYAGWPLPPVEPKIWPVE